MNVHNLANELKASAAMNLVRWNGDVRSEISEDIETASRTYDSKVAIGKDFITNRCKALSKGFAQDGAMLYYDANGGSGYAFNPYIAKIGDSVEVIGTDRVTPEQWLTVRDFLNGLDVSGFKTGKYEDKLYLRLNYNDGINKYLEISKKLAEQIREFIRRNIM